MTEQQPYELVRRYADFELRRYPAYAVAEVEVRGTFDRAGNAAFRYLFNYISGNNTSRQSVEMTAPVLQASAPRTSQSQKVQMTAPVLQEGPLGLAEGGSDEGRYVVAFVLPAGMTEDAAPIPADPRVRIRTVPACVAAVVRFSGRGTESDFAKRNRQLQDALAAAEMRPSGPPRFARFDPPFKPWFLRHNEVVQDVVPGDAAGPQAES
ncbi:heme-binding protein [Sinomonas cellulolyticus]|uniref:Heme-binding protein n=1 Tax=Sinomonas cellulolyticus TaxID=2801916 RepID=A0ABS1K6B4_9MICC|nr:MULTISPECIES: heme-binding protein [Sinomonas]MBL0707220.1 heme-binding protein [Sinomonas cellulolyticus]GHG50099.1 heme-binding protein [Sinomonas sp. KCTC 49339]